ncbi:Mycothiol acetyltransferase [Nocardioides aquaticus]|uniref:Mycothiol acetyltransferase n=1 Tax=Nocardioides aquaticus TaxID=160826 RepID=A0ABX8EKH5_9ACTN|nr:GNAT family N-acetyltransferase [Nocardioides aquaticus]QVT79113.1 Mycothiol acetyltransferase [Nocardioides aquaticus]
MSAPDQPVVRPMRPEDVPAAERLKAETFHQVDARMLPRSVPLPERRSPERGRAWVERTHHLLRTDPGGCWVAEDEDGLAGFATSLTRELMWILATYAVRPDLQGRGTGRVLLEAALHHGRGCLRGMLCSSDDPRAFRRYRLAGFTMHPFLTLRGTVDRSAIPLLRRVREATPADTDLMDSVDRRTRGAAHGPDHALMQRTWRPVVCDSGTGSGYAYLAADGSVALLAATDRRTATELLWTALADGSADGSVQQVHHVTAANEWAVDVAMTARMEVTTSGFLAVRGMRPPAPYLPSGALL